METGGFLYLEMDGDVVEISPPKDFGSSKSRSLKRKKALCHEVIQIDADDSSSDERVGANNHGKTVSAFRKRSNEGKGKETFPSSFTGNGVENTGLRNIFQPSSIPGLVKHGSNLDGDIFNLSSDDEDEYTDMPNIEIYEVDTNKPWLSGFSQGQQMQVNFTSSSHASFQPTFNGVNQTLNDGINSNMHMSSSNHYSTSLVGGFSSNVMQSVGAKTLWGSNSLELNEQFSINGSIDPGMYAETSGADLSSGLYNPMHLWQDPPQFDYNQFDNAYYPICEEVSVSLPPQPQATTSKTIGSVDEVLKELDLFKQFDTVDDCSDHHYAHIQNFGIQPQRRWMKAVQDEWKILQKDLPDTIFVRVYESRMDLLRAAMVGAQGTPYHDGLFFFDVSFPPGYPSIPPNVYYHSGGLRLNPNLYDNGKVCLSLLGTWPGRSTNEKWIPDTSTMLQVLVSIQALILNEKPYFNEPGYEASMGTVNGEKKSLEYSEDTWKKSLKTMLYTMKNPAKHFEELITNHFQNHAHAILEACTAYMDGAQVGSFARGKPQLQSEKSDRGKKISTSKKFKADAAVLINLLVKEFTRIGANDCEKFIVANVPDPQTKGKKPAAPKMPSAKTLKTLHSKIMKLDSLKSKPI